MIWLKTMLYLTCDPLWKASRTSALEQRQISQQAPWDMITRILIWKVSHQIMRTPRRQQNTRIVGHWTAADQRVVIPLWHIGREITANKKQRHNILGSSPAELEKITNKNTGNAKETKVYARIVVQFALKRLQITITVRLHQYKSRTLSSNIVWQRTKCDIADDICMHSASRRRACRTYSDNTEASKPQKTKQGVRLAFMQNPRPSSTHTTRIAYHNFCSRYLCVWINDIVLNKWMIYIESQRNCPR